MFPNGKFRSKVVPNTLEGFEKLADWLRWHEVKKFHACMEVTGMYLKSIAEFLTEAGHAVSVVNPAQISAFGSAVLNRTKLIKKMPGSSPVSARNKGRSSAEPPPPELKELRSLVTRRDAIEHSGDE
jgi:transposase